MAKPLHVGQAAENGVTAALLAARGFTADPVLQTAPGVSTPCREEHGCEKTSQGFGKTWSIVEPGVSIKPYPCGVLTHPTIDLMLKLVAEHNVKPDDIEAVKVYAGTNILKPIRYPIAANHLQAKFSLPAALAMIALARKAGEREFSDEFMAPLPRKRCSGAYPPSLIPTSRKWASTRCARALRLDQEMDARSKAGPMSATAVDRKTRLAMRIWRRRYAPAAKVCSIRKNKQL